MHQNSWWANCVQTWQPTVICTTHCHQNRAPNSEDLFKCILIKYEEFFLLLASTDAINSSLLLSYLLLGNIIKASLFLPFINESTFLHKPTEFAWSAFESTELHKRWSVVQAERWANSEDVADSFKGLHPCDCGLYWPRRRILCVCVCVCVYSMHVCVWSIWGQPPCLLEETENTPDYSRFRTELLSVSETSYKNERGSGHMNICY